MIWKPSPWGIPHQLRVPLQGWCILEGNKQQLNCEQHYSPQTHITGPNPLLIKQEKEFTLWHTVLVVYMSSTFWNTQCTQDVSLCLCCACETRVQTFCLAQDVLSERTKQNWNEQKLVHRGTDSCWHNGQREACFQWLCYTGHHNHRGHLQQTRENRGSMTLVFRLNHFTQHNLFPQCTLPSANLHWFPLQSI